MTRPHLRLVHSNPMPAWVPDPPRASVIPVVLAWGGIVALSYFTFAGLAWTAYAVCPVTGMCR